jgi:hypothetical protein
MLTEAEARARIILFGNTGEEPALASEEIDILVTMAKRIDKYGVWPTDTSWEPTWDTSYSVAQAWLIKAGRLAPRYLFMEGGKMFSRQQYYDHCMKMYAKFMGKSPIKAIRLSPQEDVIYAAVDNNWNY